METFVYQDQTDDGVTASYTLTYDLQPLGVNKGMDSVLHMTYDMSGTWTEKCRDVEIGRVIDSGNGTQVTIGEHSLNLDYAEIGELHVLLECYFDTQCKGGMKVRKFKEINCR